MAQGNFEACHAVTAKYEGRFVNHPADPGGATNWGVTRAVLAAWRGRPVSVQEVRDMPYAEALAIFRKKFWDTIGADGMPRGVDLCCYDWGVNSGPARGKRAYADTAAIADIAKRVKAIMAARRGFYAAIIARNGKLAAFSKGWANRAAGIEAIAYKWALQAQGLKPADVQRQMGAEAAQSGQQAVKKDKQAKASGGAVASGGGGAVVASWDWQTLSFIAIVVGVIGFVGFMAWRAARIERARAEAFTGEAVNG